MPKPTSVAQHSIPLCENYALKDGHFRGSGANSIKSGWRKVYFFHGNFLFKCSPLEGSQVVSSHLDSNKHPLRTRAICCSAEPQELLSESAAWDRLLEPGNNLLKEEQCREAIFCPIFLVGDSGMRQHCLCVSKNPVSALEDKSNAALSHLQYHSADNWWGRKPRARTFQPLSSVCTKGHIRLFWIVGASLWLSGMSAFIIFFSFWKKKTQTYRAILWIQKYVLAHSSYILGPWLERGTIMPIITKMEVTASVWNQVWSGPSASVDDWI